jgi:hypothetical protein
MSTATTELRAVRVAYNVERTVYVYAATDREARQLARSTSNWADEDTPFENLDSIRVKRDAS